MRCRTPLAALAALTLPLAQVGCATSTPLESGKPLEVRAQPLPPYQVHEECVSLVPGDRLHYRFESTAPIAFNIHYHDGKVVVMPVTHERIHADDSTFTPLVAQHYCLMWEAGAQGAVVDYSLRLVHGTPR